MRLAILRAMTKRLYKSETNKVLAGVCGGVGEYFDIDPVLVRLVYLLATVFTGVVPGGIAYIIAASIVPDKPHVASTSTPKQAAETHDHTGI
jgi:phage shock protein C